MDGLSILPVMAGINYEYRFTESKSIWTDLALGLSIPLSGRIDIWGSEYYHSFEPGGALSPEIGLRYNDFSFSFKFIYSWNDCQKYEYSGSPEYNWSNVSRDYNSKYFLFQLGYHF